MLDDVIELAKEGELDKRALLTVTMELLREAEAIERKSSDLKGKAAIEYLLSCKYGIVTDRDIPQRNRDILIDTIDGVINKMVVRYKVEHKKDKFTFKEDATPVQQLFYFPQSHPEFDNEMDLHREIHRLRFELDKKKGELIKMTVNSPLCKPLQDEIRGIEDKIKELIREIADKKAFSTYGIDSIDSNKENLREHRQKRRLKMSRQNEKLSEKLEKHIETVSRIIESKQVMSEFAGAALKAGAAAGRKLAGKAAPFAKKLAGKAKAGMSAAKSKAGAAANKTKAAIKANPRKAAAVGAGAVGAAGAAAGLRAALKRNKK